MNNKPYRHLYDMTPEPKQPIVTRALLFIYNLANSQLLRKITLACVAALLLLFVSDIHRYGAWYNGGATYIKPYWIYLVIALWIPIIIYAVSKGLKYLADKEMYTLLSVVVIGGFIFLFFFSWTCWSLAPSDWWDKGLIRNVDRKFWEAILIPVALVGIYYFDKWLDTKVKPR